MTSWTRVENGYRRGTWLIVDNGAGKRGSAEGAERWTLLYDGQRIGCFDYLADAKARADRPHPLCR